MDQPAGLMDKIEQVATVEWAFNALKERQSGNWGEWEKKYPGATEVVKEVERLSNG